MNGYSQQWDSIYHGNSNMSIWPWSDLISFTMRYANPNGSSCRVLELGCGAGANIPFFLNLGVKYHAIEGSESIVRLIKEKYPMLKDTIMVGDFTKDIPFAETFDLVFDRASVTHNSEEAIKRCLDLVWNKMAGQSAFIGIDWFANGHSDELNGEPAEDIHTRTNFKTGQFLNVGRVHFSDKLHLFNLFRRFEFEAIERKVRYRILPDEYTIATWNFVAKRKNK